MNVIYQWPLILRVSFHGTDSAFSFLYFFHPANESMIVKSAVKKSDPHMTLLMLVNLVENISSKEKKSCTLKKGKLENCGANFPISL